MHTFAQKPKATQQTTSAKSPKPSRSFVGQSRDVQSVLRLQQTIGNHAVLRLLQTATENLDSSLESNTSTGFAHDFSRIPVFPCARSTIQSKLKVNAPKDRYAQEADRVTEQVMRMPEPQAQADSLTVRPSPQQSGSELRLAERGSAYEEQAESVAEQVMAMPIPIPRHSNPQDRTLPSSCTAVEQVPFSMNRRGRGHLAQVGEPYVRTPDKTQRIPEALKAGIAALRGGGQPLTPETRGLFEPRFGYDFSDVRIHTHPDARQLAKSLGAKGLAVGDHIILASGNITPRSPGEMRLLAHELAHVVQGQRNVISLSWDDPAGPERTRFRALERSLREHGFGFVEEGEYFRVYVPPIIGPSLGIYDLIPAPERFHRSEILSAMLEWLPLAIRLEQRSALAGAVQGPNIVDILDAAFAFRWLRSPRGPLWVMNANDTYTRRVRLWGPVTNQLAVVKQHLEENCEEWRSAHRTNPSWTPTNPGPPQVDPPPHAWDDPSQDNPECGSWAIRPSGTGAQDNQSAYAEYQASGDVPDQLWTSAIGSFGLYVMVDSISCENGSAVLNVWMYNNMDQESFGNPESWFSAGGAAMLWSGGVDAQYMWWNWTEPHHWVPRAPE